LRYLHSPPLTAPDEQPAQDAAFDDALAHATLVRVARGEQPASLRLYRPAPAVQFGRLDRRAPGFEGARRAAEAHGFAPVLRMVGGNAAAHDRESLVFELFTRDDMGSDVHARFAAAAARLAAALTALGVDARVGPIEGEYCAGDYSINSAGTLKIAGLAQRVVRGAALVAAMIVVGSGDPIRAVLVDVYRELGIEWDPSTAGALRDHHPALAIADVEHSIRSVFTRESPWAEDAATRALARELLPRHRLARSTDGVSSYRSPHW
jgi:lipoate-protein ligase A